MKTSFDLGVLGGSDLTPRLAAKDVRNRRARRHLFRQELECVVRKSNIQASFFNRRRKITHSVLRSGTFAIALHLKAIHKNGNIQEER
jgi:hypothetical protein